jgi:hypothetical protein
MNIIDEIISYRTNELIAGRNPKEIRLSDDQKDRLARYIKEARVMALPFTSSRDEIFGMKIV